MWHCCPGMGTQGPSYEKGKKGETVMQVVSEKWTSSKGGGRKWGVGVLCTPGNSRTSQWEKYFGHSQMLIMVPLEHLDRYRMGGVNPAPFKTL